MGLQRWYSLSNYSHALWQATYENKKEKQMKIKERTEYASKPKPLTFTPDVTVSEAIKPMVKNNFGAAVVVNKDDTIAGIVTERDFMKRLLHEGRDPNSTKLSEIMTTEVRSATENDDVVDWLRIMSNERFRHLPVVDEAGKIISMMSQGDFVSYTWPDLIENIKIKAKETWGIGHQVILIVVAMLAYALIVQLMT